MTKTIFEDEKKVEVNEPKVKQMTRRLGAFSSGSTDAIQAVDEELSMWINGGWKLLSTHYIGMDTQSGIFVLYVLTKD